MGGGLEVAIRCHSIVAIKNASFQFPEITLGILPGIGGGMELAQKARRLIVTTTHTTRDGKPKIISACRLPLTAKGCVNTIITELAVIDIAEKGLMLREIAAETDVDTVIEKTGARLRIPDRELPRF